MTLKAFSLTDLIKSISLNDTKLLLDSFKGIHTHTSAPHDVEVFLRDKAIEFEKSGISSTYLVFDVSTNELVGFFSLANKPLIFSKKEFQALSKNKQKLFNRHGRRLESGGHQVNSYLIGQLGKNYRLLNNQVSGQKLLSLAYEKVKEAARIINTKYIWLECDGHPKLIEFYKRFGFSLIENFDSQDSLKVLIMKIK